MRLTLVVASFLITASAPALAGWSSLGDAGPPTRDGGAVVFRTDAGTVTVRPVTPAIIRVRFTPTGAPARRPSYALTNAPLGPPAAARVTSTADRTTIATTALTVTVRHRPLRVSFAAADGRSLDEDDGERGLAFTRGEARVWKRLRDDEHVYGLGEKGGRLDKRGRALGGYAYAMWNSDTFGYDSDTDPIYASVPFFLVLRGGRAHGFFVDETGRGLIDVGHEAQELLSFGAQSADGALEYTFIDGPTPKDVVARYTALTGRIPLPPRWALGYQQCRWSYFPEAKVRFIADNFRQRHIPADAIWLDIDYQDGFKPFTWDPARFPDPRKLIGDLAAGGFRVVTIVDPHPPIEPGYRVYDEAVAGDHLVKGADGKPFVGEVWPMRATPPRKSVYPDFTRAATRTWWGGLYAPFLDLGVAGIWNDMNEPAVGQTVNGTMPFDVRHDGDGHPGDHRELHNVYGMQMSRATFEGLARLRPDARPFVLTRATFAGGQRYAAVWTGDNQSDWAHLRLGIPMLLGLGLSGFSLAGNDIGGFVESASADLFTRWAQAAVFFPFMRAHTTRRSLDQEPWSYGLAHEAINRRAIELRYELLPTIYNEMREASVTGIPAMRPLVLEFPDDPKVADVDDEFLWGRDLLVAPVLREITNEREVYLPRGDWYDYWTGKRFAGAQTVRIPVTLATLPIFVRAGGIVFRHPVVQHTGELAGKPLIVAAYPGGPSQARLYEDDGVTRAYARGELSLRTFVQRRSGRTVAIEARAPEGRYRPAPRDLLFMVVGASGTRRVMVDGRSVAPVTAAALEAGARGWTTDEQGFVRVRTRDTFAAVTVRLE